MDPRNFRTVLVPVDFSDPSLEALASARELVGGDASKLQVVYVLPELHPLDPAVSSDVSEWVRRERAERTIRERLEGLDLADVGGVVVRVGDPGRTIVAIAGELSADLVVISSHGYTGLKHLLLGSVAEKVVRLAPCPVLVLRRAPAA